MIFAAHRKPSIENFSVFYYYFPHFWQLKTSKITSFFIFEFFSLGKIFGNNKKADYTT